MFKAIKLFLRNLIGPGLYAAGILICLQSIFKKAEKGLILLVAIIPWPNIYYKLHGYPYGHMLIDLLFLSVLLGIWIQKIKGEKTGNEKWVILLILINYAAVWNTSFNFSLPLPISTSNSVFVEWKNFIRAPLLYFFIVKIVKNERQQRVIMLIICIVILLISIKSYRNFSGGAAFNYDKRVGGPFEACGLGSTHFGAFMASYVSAILGLFTCEKDKIRKILFLVTFLFSLHPIFFAYSRGAYLGLMAAMFLIGMLKDRKFIILLIVVVLAWKTILPVSVVDRIAMTRDENTGEIEHSAAGRLELWDVALEIFNNHPLFGVGYSGFKIMMQRGDSSQVENLSDTHNYFVKILCDQGLIGLSILLIVFFKAFKSGWELFKKSRNSFQSGLGLGFMACVIALGISNFFGDRFSYLVSGSYFWVIWGLVDRGILISQGSSEQIEKIPIKILGRTLYI